MRTVTIEISGLDDPFRMELAKKEIGGAMLYRKGSLKEMFVDMNRADADLAVIGLNCIYGVRARLINN